MPIKLVTKTVFRCKCVRCGWEWDAERKPLRCADCKYRSWNGEDHRFADPFQNVPKPFKVKIGKKAPRPPSYRNILEILTEARGVIRERLVRDNLDRLMERLRPFADVTFAQAVRNAREEVEEEEAAS